jgi:hypothetical protein
MKDDRLRVPIDAPYLEALGLALICFARLEWGAVWCCEKLEPGFVQTVSKMHSADIAKKLIELTASHPNAAIMASLHQHALEFKRLVRRRNDLLHAKPGTAPTGEQRLFRSGYEWTIPMVNDLTDEFAAADLELVHQFYHVL